MYKLIKIIIGINLISYALMFAVIYLNLFTLGYSLGFYLLELVTHLETLLIIPGIYLVWSSLHR